jgi:hypothetical protein
MLLPFFLGGGVADEFKKKFLAAAGARVGEAPVRRKTQEGPAREPGSPEDFHISTAWPMRRIVSTVIPVMNT